MSAELSAWLVAMLARLAVPRHLAGTGQPLLLSRVG
jgi:hypothetical protein